MKHAMWLTVNTAPLPMINQCTKEFLAEFELDAVRATLEYLYHHQSEITPNALRLNVPCSLSRRQAENVVYQLRVEGILTNDMCDVETLRFFFLQRRYSLNERSCPKTTWWRPFPTTTQH